MNNLETVDCFATILRRRPLTPKFDILRCWKRMTQLFQGLIKTCYGLLKTPMMTHSPCPLLLGQVGWPIGRKNIGSTFCFFQHSTVLPTDRPSNEVKQNTNDSHYDLTVCWTSWPMLHAGGWPAILKEYSWEFIFMASVHDALLLVIIHVTPWCCHVGQISRETIRDRRFHVLLLMLIKRRKHTRIGSLIILS